MGPSRPCLGRTYCDTFVIWALCYCWVHLAVHLQMLFRWFKRPVRDCTEFYYRTAYRINSNKPRLLDYCRLKCDFYLGTCSYFKIGRDKDYLLFPNLTVYCLFTAANRSVFWSHLFTLGPFQPVVSSIGNRMTYRKNFWRENLLDSGENNHFELKRTAFH